MTVMQLASALGEVREESVNEAADYRKPRRIGMKIGTAAACLCLVGGLVWWRMQPGVDSIYENDGGGSGVGNALNGDAAAAAGVVPAPGGYFEDERGAKLYSIAVYPASEDFSNVADATLSEISEQEMQSDPLSAYFPTVLPEGFEFDFASLYHTTMKTEREYRMLRVTYASGGEIHPVPTEDGGYAATEPTDRRSFVLFAMDYKPDTNHSFIDGFGLTAEDYVNLADGSTFHLDFGDVYLGVSPTELTPEELETVLTSLPVLNG